MRYIVTSHVCMYKESTQFGSERGDIIYSLDV